MKDAMQHVAVRSSSLRGLAYDPATQTLEVEFHSGARYRYRQVPAQLVRDLLAADSLGRFFNQAIKAQAFPFERIERASR
jgi:hypothetical protein